MKDLLNLLDVGRHATASGEVRQVRPLADEQKAHFRAMQGTPPPHCLKVLLAARKGA